MSSTPMQSEAQIYDRGYRRYEGERTGLGGAVRSLVRHSVRHALGLGRAGRYKIIPVVVVFLAYVPAIAFIGFAAIVPIGTEEFLPSFAEYYGSIVAPIYLFAGFVAPELLCTDRRTGLLGVYLASPLNRPFYLLGKAISVFLLLLLVTLGPPLLMLIAFSLQNMGPDGFVEWMRTFGRILVSSAVIGTLYTAIALGISATTDRATVAIAAVLAAIPGAGIITSILDESTDVSPVVRLANVLSLPQELIFRVQDEAGNGNWSTLDNPTWTLWAAWFFWVGISLGWVWVRYRRLLVRR
ncbi:MAG: ABC transporter permease [Actinomycetota bacterium]